ncbi:MAG: class I SAM-dependent methyltransferase [Pseudomonadota bacterium]
MRDGQASFTSRMVMFYRALAAHNPTIGIFNDSVAEQLLSPRGQRIVRRPRTYRFMARLFRRRPRLKGALASLLLRARFSEDELARAMETEGVRQYVILGAGWDTFAWRRPELMARLRVFELDYPATQAAKRDRLTERGLTTPANLVFVPIDFTTQSLSARLQESGFDPALPTFVNWMGVTYYLPLPVVEGVFRELRALCAGGVAVAFDYMDAQVRELIARQPKTFAIRLRRRIGLRIWRRIGEPFHTLLDASQLSDWLHTLGYDLRESLTQETKRDYLPPEEMGSYVPSGWMNIALAHSLPRET